MNIKVNGFDYKVIAEAREEEDEHFYFGLTENHKQEIFINTNKCVSDARIYQTIIHEITHAFHFEYFGGNTFKSETEMIAEFVSIYAEDIIKLSKKVFDYVNSVRK